MSLYPITVNYWTMRESSSILEGNRTCAQGPLSLDMVSLCYSPDRLLSLHFIEEVSLSGF